MSIETQKTYSRKKRKCFHPNLLFKKWLTEWKEDAKVNNSNMQYNFHRALKSLELYPLPLYSGGDCKILSNFGEKICAKIDGKLRRHIEDHGQINWDIYVKIDKPKKKRVRNISKIEINKKYLGTTNEQQSKSPIQTKRSYIPAYRSGAYSLLTALHNATESMSYKGFLKKDDLANLAQEFSDASFTIPAIGSHYTAWSSMSTLIKKGLVFKCGSPARYSITEDGINVVKKINTKDKSVVNSKSDKVSTLSNSQSLCHTLSDSDEDIIFIDDNNCDNELKLNEKTKCIQLESSPSHISANVRSSSVMTGQEVTSLSCNYELSSGNFEIILCVDSAETAGGFKAGKKNMKDALLTELGRQKINFDVRKLHIGDFLWIAQESSLSKKKKRELVLPFIVERKRMDDLASSIVDGRFKEQKFRLKQCGLSNPIYLVEEYGSKNTSLPLSTCEQAIANTQIIDGFQVKVTKDIHESISYLNAMTRYLEAKYKNKLLRCFPKESMPNNSTDSSKDTVDLIDFTKFNASSMKNKQLNVKDMFTKHLLQLSGLSIDKAVAIVEKYPSPRSLVNALNNCRVASRENLLSTLRCPRSGRMIGPRISSTIVQLYTSNTLY